MSCRNWNVYKLKSITYTYTWIKETKIETLSLLSWASSEVDFFFSSTFLHICRTLTNLLSDSYPHVVPQSPIINNVTKETQGLFLVIYGIFRDNYIRNDINQREKHGYISGQVAKPFMYKCCSTIGHLEPIWRKQWSPVKTWRALGRRRKRKRI